MTLTTVTATPPRFAAVTGALRTLLHGYRARASLSRLTDRQLADAALLPSDIQALRSLPLSTDVATHLSIRAGMRAGNW